MVRNFTEEIISSLIVGTTVTTRRARTITAISALQERKVTAVLMVLIAWHSEIDKQYLWYSLLSILR